jgi:hypothetical protein
VKSDLWKTFNLSVATTIAALGVGYVVTSPLDRDRAPESAGAPTTSVSGEPAFRAVSLPPSASTPSTTIEATEVDEVMAAPTTVVVITTPPPARTPTTTHAPVTDTGASGPLVPLGSPTTSVATSAAPSAPSTTTTTSTTSTTTSTTSTTTTTIAPSGSGEAPACLLPLWNPIAQEWVCLL